MRPTVKDIKDYLNTLPDDTPVYLAHDGWMFDPNFHKDIQHLIRTRGIFQKRDESKFGGGMTLVINN